MGCWRCFAQVAKESERLREHFKQKRTIFGKQSKACSSGSQCIKISGEDKEKLKKLIYKW